MSDVTTATFKMWGRQDTDELLMTEEDFQRELEKTVINRMRNYLCDHLEPERFFPFLQTKEYLDAESCEQIRNAGTTRSRVNKMLDILLKSGPKPLKALTRAIENSGTTQKFVAKKLEKEYGNVQSLPFNIERLRFIQCRGPPPPYSPSLGILPSRFVIDHSDVSKFPISSNDVVRNHPVTVADIRVTNNRLQTTISDTSQPSTFDGDRSHFRTIDFISGISVGEPESITDQYIEEQKISLQQNAYLLSHSQLSLNGERQWVRPERTPSEHDASDGCTSPTRISGVNSNNEIESTTSSLGVLMPPDGTAAGPTYNISTRPKDLKSQPSYSNGSIQASCFTSSNFGNIEILPNTPDVLKPSMKPHLSPANGNPRSPGANRMFSTLEAIPSIDFLPSIESNEQKSSISIRRPPIEHEETSIPHRNSSDDENSSLEISTDSERSEL